MNRSLALINNNIHNDIHKRYEFRKQTLLADNSLTKDEKNYAINWITTSYDRNKILGNSGTRRICENCNQKCLATLYCEFCVRNYLKEKFSNWTSGNVNIDNLIQKCQIETFEPGTIIEWIPYNNLQNIKYLTKGEFSEIYTAVWVDGRYEEWDFKKQQLKRFGRHNVILKKLENVESANQSWFEEFKRIFTTESQWKQKINIAFEIVRALNFIHFENLIHRDLHSGNILYSRRSSNWYISDLGFCGPADKSSKSVYGNLPYLAPKVISGKQTTEASDIYSVAILMWEITSEQPPFINYEHDYNLAMNIINGIRPRIVSGTPVEYKNLIEECWDADSSKRPDINTLGIKIREMNLYYQNMPDESFQSETSVLLDIVSEFYTNTANKLIKDFFITIDCV
ncbi:kinase-like domain-containing protein [Rhizophagus irregularis DAOM 181602=DAOM 197198]|nr:kinase-like domain-containing protein [Rhizophagus irregularis DAOM 181602=DAOM 197198]